MAEGRPTSSSEEPAKPESSQSEEHQHRISQAEGREAETPALQLSEAQQEPPAAAALQTSSSEDKPYWEQPIDPDKVSLSTLTPSSDEQRSLTSLTSSGQQGSQVALTGGQQQGSDQSQSHSSSAPSTLPTPGLQEPRIRFPRPGWREPTTKIFKSGCSVTVAILYPGKIFQESSSAVVLPDRQPHRPPTDRSSSMPALRSKGEVVAHGRIQPTMQQPMPILPAQEARQVASQLDQGPSFLQTRPAPRITPEVSQ